MPQLTIKGGGVLISGLQLWADIHVCDVVCFAMLPTATSLHGTSSTMPRQTVWGREPDE